MSSIKNMPIHVDINVYYKKKKKEKEKVVTLSGKTMDDFYFLFYNFSKFPTWIINAIYSFVFIVALHLI